MSWPPSPSLPAAIAQFLAAPLPPSPPAPFCVTPAHGGTATLREENLDVVMPHQHLRLMHEGTL